MRRSPFFTPRARTWRAVTSPRGDWRDDVTGAGALAGAAGVGGSVPAAAPRPGPARPGPSPGDMSTAMNFGSKSFKPRPPEKGAFPLDHLGECSAFKERFMECLRGSGYESGACRQRAMAYLECRMERQLMANEPLEKLGFKDLIDEKSEAKPEKM